MKVNYKDAAIVLILVTFGAIVLAFGGCFGWAELIRGNVSVFIFSVSILYFSFSYDKWRRNKEEDDKRKRILKGIHKEIIERARYLQHYQKQREENPEGYFVNIPVFPSSAWESAIANGYYEPQNQEWADCSYIYNATENVNLNLAIVRGIYYQSTFTIEDRIKHLMPYDALLQNAIKQLMVIIDENLQRLERDLSISREEVVRINNDITRRIEEALSK